MGEEEDGVFIWMSVCLDIGEGGTEEVLAELSAQGPSSGSHGHFPSPDVQGGLRLLVRGKGWLEGRALGQLQKIRGQNPILHRVTPLSRSR